MKITVKKDTVSFNKSYKAVKVNCSQDGVRLGDILEALSNFKDKDFLKEAFAQNNVSAYAKVYTRYHPLGYISEKQYNDYVSYKEAKARLEYLRGEIEAERMSYGEIEELRSLTPYIDKGDVQLLQWAGVEEQIN